MFNFDETRNLGELKEICFYIKAINESGFASNWSNNIGEILAYLKKEYNLEVSASKLYLFVQKILYIVNSENEFPDIGAIDNIINDYINYMRSKQRETAEELTKAQLNYEDPKFELRNNQYKSTKYFATSIALKENLYTNLLTKLVVWSAIISLFLVSVSCCVVGVFFPHLFMIVMSKPQELAILLLMFCVLILLTYLVLYLINHKKIKNLSVVIKRYYRFENLIKMDEARLNQAKHNFFVANNAISVNGMELSDDMIFAYLKNSDQIDISFYNKKNIGRLESEVKTNDLQYAKIGQTISSHEQDNTWREDLSTTKEKQLMNREIVERINELAETIVVKNLSDELVGHSISDLYCKDLSVEVRNEKINDATSKIELVSNYIEMIDKIKEYESIRFFAKSKISNKLKSVMSLSTEERLSFEKSLMIKIARIEKACSLGLLSKGEVKTYKNIEKDLMSGIVQGLQVDAIEFRYDLAKLYVKLYKELDLFDVLN